MVIIGFQYLDGEDESVRLPPPLESTLVLLDDVISPIISSLVSRIRSMVLRFSTEMEKLSIFKIFM